MYNSPKLSVCIIAKNEEKMLSDCLSSVKSIAYEIILVDTGSTDKTKEIAKQYNCKVVDFAWIDDFSAARNESLKYVTGDFVLILDADERIVNPEKISEIMKNSNKNTYGWLCKSHSISTLNNSVQQNNITLILRLFRFHPDFKFEGIIHEQIANSITNKGFKLEKSDVEILHLGYDLSKETMKNKYLRNLALLEKFLEKNPNDYYHKNHKCKTLIALEKNQEAFDFYNEFISEVKDNNLIKIEMLNYAAIAAYRINNFEKSMEFALLSRKLLPNQSFANYILGELFAIQKNYGEALESYFAMQKAIENPDFLATISGEFQLPIEQIHWKIGKILFEISDFSGAINEFEKGLKNAPNDANCLIGLANVAFKMKQFSQAKEVLEIAFKVNPNFPEILEFIKQIDDLLSKENLLLQKNTNKMEKISEKNEKKLLTVCMIVKNEEKMLAGCLDSVKNIADEIIIVDTGSSDKTIEIAQKYNAKIYDFAWIDDFSAARNESIKYATSEWILYLDADERLTVSSQNQIRLLLSSSNENIGGYFCTIESEHSKMDGSAEKHRGGYPRLFRNLGFPNIKFMGRVHEQISPSLISAQKTILVSDIIIEHLGYNLSREEMEKKVKRNYSMLLSHINEEPTNGYAWFQLGQTLGQMGLQNEAEDATRFAINCGNLSGSVYASAAATVAQFCGRKKNFEEALHWANESLKKAPNQLYGLSLKAHSLLYMGRKKEAEIAFIEALNLVKSNTSMPRTGFDIDISEEILQKGLTESRK